MLSGSKFFPRPCRWISTRSITAARIARRRSRLRFVCHPKCRYQRVVPFDRWTRAVERALEAGHGEILVRYL